MHKNFLRKVVIIVLKHFTDKKIVASLLLGIVFGFAQLWLFKETLITSFAISFAFAIGLIIYYLLTHQIVKFISQFAMWKHVIFVILLALFGYFFRITGQTAGSIFQERILYSASIATLYWVILVVYIVFITFTSIIQHSKLVDSLNNLLLPLMGSLTVYSVFPLSQGTATIYSVMAVSSLLIFCVMDYRSSYS